MKKIILMFGIVIVGMAVFCLASMIPCVMADSPPKCPAKLCSGCGFGSKSNNCVKCGRWVGSTTIYARLCGSCGFGSKKDNCVKCGRWVGNTQVYGKLCSDCGFSSKKNNCVKCGRWAPD